MIEVAAGILVDDGDRVLLMQRLPGKHLAGLWEFPGGKLEPGETIEEALARELNEELGVEVLASAPLISLPWRYPEKTVRLHALRVTAWHGEPRPREGHPLKWIAPRDMDIAAMPPADAPIVTALRLPPYYAIVASGALPATGPVARDVPPGQGAEPARVLWQLRMPGACRDEIRCKVQEALATHPALRASLLINHDIDLARELGVGVHLKASQLRGLDERPLPRDLWVGASCHDAEQLERAATLDADFATLSPVCATASHPDAEPLGWKRLADWIADARLPVYALGGVGPDDLERAHAAGAQGVAGIRACGGSPA
jgi:8-oxo-dGTP diphosphatase